MIVLTFLILYQSSFMIYCNQKIFQPANDKPFSSPNLGSETIHKNSIHHQIKKAELIACGSFTCSVVTEFYIDETFSFNCYDRNLPINFEVQHINGTLILQKGFLPLMQIIMNIEERPIKSFNQILNTDNKLENPSCLKIKRYFINSNQLLISIGSSMKLVDRYNPNRFIIWELFVHYEFITLFEYLLGIYNEDKDTYITYITLLYINVLLTIWELLKFVKKFWSTEDQPLIFSVLKRERELRIKEYQQKLRNLNLGDEDNGERLSLVSGTRQRR